MNRQDPISRFRAIDVRGIPGNFFRGLEKQALRLPAGNGPEIVRSFGPIKACAALWKTHNAAHEI